MKRYHSTRTGKPYTVIRFGFKSRTQLPLFMIWREYRDERGRVEFAMVIFNTYNWIGY